MNSSKCRNINLCDIDASLIQTKEKPAAEQRRGPASTDNGPIGMASGDAGTRNIHRLAVFVQLFANKMEGSSYEHVYIVFAGC